MSPVRQSTGLDRRRFPLDPWSLREIRHNTADLGLTETLFCVGNGYLGLRDNPPEGRIAHQHGTFINGFHETWPIHHAETAHGFATTGQTIVNVPDAKLMKLYVDDEPLIVDTADLIDYTRELDFRDGVSRRDLLWRTPGGGRVRVTSERMVSLVHRHLVVLTLTVEVLDKAASLLLSSQLLNRQDGQDEYHVVSAALGEGDDPRRSSELNGRVLDPVLHRCVDTTTSGDEVVLGHQCHLSGMTIASSYRHLVMVDGATDDAPLLLTTSVEDDLAKTEISVRAEPGARLTVTKFVSYHTSAGVPCIELADRARRTISRAVTSGVDRLRDEQRGWLDRYWDRCDVEITGDTEAQQAVRWNLFQLAQTTAQSNENGIAAKGVSGAGYDGHYFWDTEVYVVPFLARTDPEAARKLLRFRHRLLDAARKRAGDLSQRGALYPWRTISGEEASAYYAAGTAQYHINAAVAYALECYTNATGDTDLLFSEGAEILVETARMWADLGFIARDGRFHIHRVTGPDEYTTVVNDNLYTNVMARFNLRFAADTVRILQGEAPGRFADLHDATGVSAAEVQTWDAIADMMYLPYDDDLGIHPQDDSFLDLEPWDFDGTPPDQYPLLLHFHPLVIYRHQVLKQADVVLAMYLRSEHFDLDQRRRNFDYYDPITTGDSSLSACVQSIVGAQVGADDAAWRHFQDAMRLDLCDTHHNTSEGIHVANAAGLWAGVVDGFLGMDATAEVPTLNPRLPSGWTDVTARVQHRGRRFLLRAGREGHEVIDITTS